MFHVGQHKLPTNIFDDLSIVINKKDYTDYIEEGLNKEENLVDKIQMNQSFLDMSLFNLKTNLINFFNTKKPLGSINSLELPLSSVIIKINRNENSTSIEIERVLVLWNSVWISSVIQLIDDFTKLYASKIKEVFKTESVNKSSTKTSDALNKDNNSPKRNKRFTKIEKDRTKITDNNSKYNSTDDCSKTQSSIYSIHLKLIQFFNFNKSFFQTEILIEDLNCILRFINLTKDIELSTRSLTINDLTGYPFTKPFFELKNPKNIKRQIILSLKIPSDPKNDYYNSNKNDKQIMESLLKNSLCARFELKSPEEVINDPERIKNTASIYIRSATVTYYQQLIFRLIDLINLSIYPTVLPDVVPTDPLKIWTRMTDFYRTRYTINIYQSEIILKPNKFFNHSIQLRINETIVTNKVQSDNTTDLSKQNRPFYTETISIKTNRVFWKGYSSPKESILFNTLDIHFTRFLFHSEVKLYYGKQNFLSTVKFGNRVEISSESLHLNLNRNDFILLMTTLYGNINFDDLRSSDYLLSELDENDKYANPMNLSVEFKQLFVYFRYDLLNDLPKVFCVFSLPFFKVQMDKFIDCTKNIIISSKYVKSWTFEVTENLKREIKSVQFIQPIFSGNNDCDDDFGISLLTNHNKCNPGLSDRHNHKYNSNHLDDFFENISDFYKSHNIQPTNPQNFHNFRDSGESKNIHHNNNQYFNKNTNLNHSKQDNKEFSKEEFLFVMNVKTDSKGSYTSITVTNHKIVFIQTVFFKLMEFTQMIQEMGINSMMQPLIESNPSNVKFELLLLSTLITIPFDSTRFPQPITIYIGHGSTVYNRSLQLYSEKLSSKMSFFQSISRLFDLGYSDHPLSMFENALNLEKLNLFQIDYILDFRKVNIFIPQIDDPYLLIKVFENKICCPDFPKSVFKSTHSESNDMLRFIAYDMSMTHSTETLFSNSYRSVLLTKGNLKTSNFVFALTTSDFVYLSDFGSFLTKFGFENLKFEDSIRLEIVDILLKNTSINSNEYSYSKSLINTSQRKHTDLEKIDIQLIILDDIYDTLTPLVKMRLTVEPTLMLKTYVFEDLFKTEFMIDIQTFNCPLRIWEPLVENLSLKISKSTSELLGKQNMTINTLNNAECINVSVESVNLFLSIQKNFKHLKEGYHSNESNKEIVENYLNLSNNKFSNCSQIKSIGRNQINSILDKNHFNWDHLIQSPFRIQNKSGRIIEVIISHSDVQFFRCVIYDQDTCKIPNVKTSKDLIFMEIYVTEFWSDFGEEDLKNDYSQTQQTYNINGHQIKCHRDSIVDDYFDDVFENNGLNLKENENKQSTIQSSKKLLKKYLLCSFNNPFNYFTNSPKESKGYYFYKVNDNSRVDFKISSSCVLINKSKLTLIVKCNKDDKSYNCKLENNKSMNIPIEFEKGLISFAEIIEMNQNSRIPKILKMSVFSQPIDTQKEFIEYINVETNQLERECVLKIGSKYLLLKATINDFSLELSIDAPLFIENATFRKLKIIDPDGTGFEAIIKKGETEFPIYYKLNENINLIFKMTDLQSNKISFKKKDFLKESLNSKFWLIDESGNSTVKVSVHISKGDRIRMLFYHDSILVNETFVNWWFSQTIKNKNIRNTILVPLLQNSPQILFVKYKKPLLFGCENHQGSTIQLDLSKSEPTFYSFKTLDNKTLEFSVSLENRRVSEYSNVFQKIVHFVQKYIFINQTKHSVILVNHPKSSEIHLSPNSRMPIAFISNQSNQRTMCLKIGSHCWSQPIDYSKTEFYRFSVETEKRENCCLMNMEVNFSNNSFYSILIESQIGCCHISNRLNSFCLLLYQNPSEIDKFDLLVNSESSQWYSWKYPLDQTEKLHFIICQSNTRNRVGNFTVDVNLKETRQTIKINQQSITIQTYERGYSLIVEVMPVEQLFEGKPLKKNKLKSEIKINIEAIGFSLIFGERKIRKELAFIHLDNLLIRSKTTEKTTEFELTLDYSSVDFNAKKLAIFPVLLVPKFKKNILALKNAKSLKLKIIKKNDCFSLNVFENIELEIFPCVLKIEEECLVCALKLHNQFHDMIKTQSEFFENKFPKIEEAKPLLKSLKKNWKVVFIEETQSLFIQRVFLSEIEIILSFRKSLEIRTSNKSLTNYLNIQNALGAFFTTIDDFPLTLPDIHLSRDSKSVGVLKELLMERYKTVAFNSVLKLIASSNLIGNPLNLYNEFKSAFKELIRTENRITNNWTGNTQSFVKHVVAGTSGTVTKMARTMSDGLGALTIDNDYLLERERLYARSENKFLIGLKQMGFGVVDGLRGLILKPVEGGKNNGFKGVMKGTYQGVSGLIIKPLTGFLDMTSATADGIRQMCLNKQLMSSDSRQRPPRAFYSRKRYFKTYDWNDAEYHLTDLGNDELRLIIVEDINCNLEKIVICFEGIFIIDNEEIVWQCSIEYIVGVICKDLLLTIECFNVQNDKIIESNRLVVCQTEESGQKIYSAINKAIDSFNKHNLHDEESSIEDESNN